MATIRDVAQQANVSVTTVSHVINQTRFVEPETEKRVRIAITQLGYRPNSLARSLRRGGTSTIGLLVPDNSNPFFADVARAIEDAGFAQGYSVVLCNSDMSPDKEDAYIDVLLSKQVDGLILISSSSRTPRLEAAIAAGMPVVVVDRELNDLPVDQVLVDNAQGGYLAGRYLVEHGHTDIACITGPRLLAPSAARVAGFRRALDEVGLELRPEAIFTGDFRYSGGEAAVQHFQRQRLPVSAIFATNDVMAIGAIMALRRVHLAVPTDVSVIGFDNIVQSAALSPALTTIAQPIKEIGQTSFALLHERIKNRDTPPTRNLLPTTLVERESCRLWSTPHATPPPPLNRQLAHAIATMHPGDVLLIADADAPNPPAAHCIDLALAPGVPSIADVLHVLAPHLPAFASISVLEGADDLSRLSETLPNTVIRTLTQDRFAAFRARATVVVRTGDGAAARSAIIGDVRPI